MVEGRKPSPFTHLENQMEITLKSPKEEIIDSSLELIDKQATQLAGLREDRKALIAVVALLFTTTFLF